MKIPRRILRKIALNFSVYLTTIAMLFNASYPAFYAMASTVEDSSVVLEQEKAVEEQAEKLAEESEKEAIEEPEEEVAEEPEVAVSIETAKEVSTAVENESEETSSTEITTEEEAPVENLPEQTPAVPEEAPADTEATPEEEATEKIEVVEEENQEPETGVWEENENGSMSVWVEEGAEYEYKDSGLKIKFTRIDDKVGEITVKEIELSEEQIETLNALSSKAWDITSEMEDGTFEYELTLPMDEEINKEEVQIVYAEEEEDLISDEKVKAVDEDDFDVNNEEKEIIATMDHFTVFVVTQTSDSSDGSVHIVNVSENNKLTNSDNNRMESDSRWTTSNYSDSRYIEFRFTPGLPDGATVTGDVKLKFEYQRDALALISNNYKARLLIYNGSSWAVLASDVKIDNPNQDKTFTITIPSGYTNTTDKINNLKIRFQLAGRGFFSASGIKTEHDYVALDFSYKLATPILNLPTNNSVVKGIPTLTNSWSSVSGAVKYEYESYHDEAMQHPRYSETYPTTSKSADNVSDATFWWRVRAVDANENKSDWSELWKVTVDNTPPLAPTLTSPVDGAIVKGNPTQSWNAVSGADHYYYESYFDEDGNNRAYYTDIPGTSRIVGGNQTVTFWWRVKSVDKAGNESGWSEMRKLIVDNTAPVIILIGDAVLDVAQGSDYFDAGATCLDIFDENCSVVVLSNVNTSAVGSYTVKYDAIDSVGNSAIQIIRNVNVVDQTAPIVKINSPLESKTLKGTVDIYGTIMENVAMGNYNIAIYPGDADFMDFSKRLEQKNVDPSTIFFNQKIYQWDTTKYPDGEYLIRFAGRDKAGNRDLISGQEYTGGDDSQHVIKVKVDNTAPIITFDQPISDSLHNGVIHLKATCNEDCDYVNFWWRKDGESFDSDSKRYHYVNDNGMNFEWDLDTLNAKKADNTSYIMEDGTYYLYAAGKDLVGNWARTAGEIKVVIDNTAPVVEITSPIDEGFVSGVVDIKGSVQDANPHHYWLAIFKNNQQIYSEVKKHSNEFSEELLYSWNTIGLSDGEYQIKFAARDIDDNTGNRSSDFVVDIIVDNTKPTSTIDGGNDGETIYIDEWDGTFSGTATDNLSGIEKVELMIKRDVEGAITYWNGVGWQAEEKLVVASGTTAWTYGPLALPLVEGEYTIQSHAIDKAGNREETYTLTIVYDKTIPEVNLAISPASPNGNNNWYISSPEITLTANDNTVWDKIEYQLNSKTGTTWTAYTSPVKIEDGQTAFYYRSFDKAGNESAIGVKNVKVDTQDPDEVKDVDAEYSEEEGEVELSWDVEDSDIYKVYIYRGKSRNFKADSTSKVAENDDNDENYKDDNVDPGEKYYYKLIARDEAGNASDAKVISITIPAEEGGTAVVTDEGTEAVEEEVAEEGGTADEVLGEQTNNEEEAVVGEEGSQTEENSEGDETKVLGDWYERSLLQNWKFWLIIALIIGFGGWFIYRRRSEQN